MFTHERRYRHVGPPIWLHNRGVRLRERPLWLQLALLDNPGCCI